MGNRFADRDKGPIDDVTDSISVDRNIAFTYSLTSYTLYDRVLERPVATFDNNRIFWSLYTSDLYRDSHAKPVLI